MDSDLIIKALNYHGQEFRRALDSEAASDVFENVDMREVNYLQYHQRAKEFGFEERNQRQKLHKFLGRKAHLLYMPISDESPIPMETDFQSDEIYAVMPPLESYMGIPGHERRKHFYEVMKKGDPVVGMITALQNGGFVITLICTDGGKRREIHDLGIKCFCTVGNALLNDKHDDVFSLYHIKDLVRGAVINEPSNPAIERLYISMKPEHLAFEFQNKLKMGLITEEDLPIHYRRSTQFKDKSYSEVLEWNLNFSNPTNIYQLGSSLGLNVHKTETYFKHMHGIKYEKEEYACALRKQQSSKWAFKRIKEGVTQFKAGNHIEAYQCLNKALHIDPESVEGLVARGALFANNNNLMKAVEDFEKALEINPQHGNAQKYLSETLIAIGKRCQEKGDIDGACKNYKRAIAINGSDEAKEALAFAEKSLNSKDANHSRTSSLVNADTRQKLLLLLQDDKEKSFSKNIQPLSPSDVQVLSTSHKTHSHRTENPLNPHDNMHLHKMSLSKSNMYEGGKSCQQPENTVVATTTKVNFIKDGTALTHGDNIHGKKKMYDSNVNKSPISSIETREGPISLEERLKQYYKKVGENDELKQQCFIDNEISPEGSHKMSRKPRIYVSDVCSRESNSSLLDKTAAHVREGVRTEQQHYLKCEHKHVNTLPFSDHSNSSYQATNTTYEKKESCVIKKSFKTLNSENCNTEKGDKKPCKLVTKSCSRSYKLNISPRNSESSLCTGYNKNDFRKSKSLVESKSKRKYVYSKSSSNDVYNSRKYSSRCDGHRSISSSHHKPHLSENKHYHHTAHNVCKLNSSRDFEASYRKHRAVICRAPDPVKLRQLRDAARLSRMSVVKSPVSEKHGALEAAKAAAQKITEALQHTNENNDFSAVKKQTLHQMEMFLEKLRSQKKTDCNSNKSD